MLNYFFCKTNKDLIFAEIDENTIQFQEIFNSNQYILIKLNDKLDLSNKFYLDENNNVKSIDLQLEALKKEKTRLLNNDFNVSKKITIQNGNTLIIDYNTPERKYFFDKLKLITQESTRQDISISYQQENDGSSYTFSAIPKIWAYIFKDLFLADRIKDGQPTGFKEDVREQNQIKFNITNLLIQRATTHEELNGITWNFTKPNGIVIDISDKAEQMLADTTVDAYTKAIINNAKDPVTGEIHLINKV